MGKGYFRSLGRRVKNRLLHQNEPLTPKPTEETAAATATATETSLYGVLVWHDCPHATVDVCFVHGLTGDRDRTWTAQGQPDPWPKTLLPPELPNARILTYGYDAYFMTEGVSSGNRLIDHARNLVSELTTNRRANNAENRPLIFIVHSLGGLVTKKGLLLSHDNREDHLQGIFKCTKSIIFMGTPHRGSWMADWAKIPVSALGVVKSVNGRLLKTLASDGELLESIQEDFSRLLRRMAMSETPIEITCFFEELPLPVVGKVVERESATLPDYNAISIHANHREMARFRSNEDRGFKEVSSLLLKWQREVELGRSMRSALVEIRQLTEIFEECRNYVSDSPNAQPHLLSLNTTLLRLGSCKLRVEGTYTQLLERACVPKIQSLMKRDAGWEDLQLQSKLRSHLKDDWVDFGKTVERLHEQLSYFKRKLLINTADKENDWEDLIHEFLEKWAATQSSHDASTMYERLIGKIVRAVERLASFAPNTDGEPQDPSDADSAGTTDLATPWLNIREHTRNVWDKLSHIWQYNCPMQQHDANIRLCPASDVTSSREQVCFNYSFLLHNHSVSAWRDVRLTTRAKLENEVAVAKIDKKGKKRARFVGMGVTIATSIVELPQRDQEGEVFDICQTIEREFQEGDRIGSLSCGNCEYVMYGEARGDRELVPLRRILPCFRNGQPIPTVQRRKISLCLASSLLMLYNTPWLPEHWSLDDVYMDPSDPTRLYRKQVYTKPGCGKPQPAPRDSESVDVVDNESIFCLAIALLELTFGAPLTNFHDSIARQQSGDRLARLITAKRLTKAIRKHEEERFASVVIKCMNPPSSSPTEYDFSFENEAFRRQFIKDVLVPLYQDVVALQGGV